MKARAMNSKTLVAAAMMMVMVAASVSSANAASHLPGLGRHVPTHTVLKYKMGAWTVPTAMVLTSADAWTKWNQDMVAAGKAIAAEPVPAGVDWKTESVLVVTLGCCRANPIGVDLANAERVALHTDVELSLAYGEEGAAYPAVAVAMNKQLASSLRLVNGAQAGLPTDVSTYSPEPVTSTVSSASTQVAVSWGEVKGAYRN
jgi:hypothetical protein